MTLKQILLLVAIAAGLAGCGKESDNLPGPNVNQAQPNLNDPAILKKIAQENQSANAQHGDPSAPLEKYQALTSGKQLMYAYLAVSTLPVDFEKVAQVISPDYRSTQDEFKKRDLLQALQPGIQGEIEKARNNRYYFIEFNELPMVDKYDFSQHSFTVFPLKQSGYRHFNEASSYGFGFSNTQAFSSLKVADENVARTIEGLRNKNPNFAFGDKQGLRLAVYFFANDTELGETKLKAEIMHIRLLDQKGSVLAER
ncbi:MAG: hypothetical protein LBV49_06400 [Azonexus sp.]|nr:hypothetical protein [Azonexus sp.]